MLQPATPADGQVFRDPSGLLEQLHTQETVNASLTDQLAASKRGRARERVGWAAACLAIPMLILGALMYVAEDEPANSNFSDLSRTSNGEMDPPLTCSMPAVYHIAAPNYSRDMRRRVSETEGDTCTEQRFFLSYQNWRCDVACVNDGVRFTPTKTPSPDVVPDGTIEVLKTY